MTRMIATFLIVTAAAGFAIPKANAQQGQTGPQAKARIGQRLAQRLRTRKISLRGQPVTAQSQQVEQRQAATPASAQASAFDQNAGQQVLRNIAKLANNPNSLVEFMVPVVVQPNQVSSAPTAYHRALFGEDEVAAPHIEMQVIKNPNNLAAIEVELIHAARTKLATGSETGWLHIGTVSDIPSRGVVSFGTSGNTCVWVSANGTTEFASLVEAVKTHATVAPRLASEFVAMHKSQLAPPAPRQQPAPKPQSLVRPVPTQMASGLKPLYRQQPPTAQASIAGDLRQNTQQRVAARPVETQSLYASAYQSATNQAYRNVAVQAVRQMPPKAVAGTAFAALKRSEIDWRKFDETFQPSLPLDADRELNGRQEGVARLAEKSTELAPASDPAAETETTPQLYRVQRMSHQDSSPSRTKFDFDFDANEGRGDGRTQTSSAKDHRSAASYTRIR